MKKLFLCIALLATVCQINAMDLSDAGTRVVYVRPLIPFLSQLAELSGLESAFEYENEGAEFFNNVAKPAAFTAALLYLQRAGANAVTRLYRSIAKPKSALAQAQVKRREQQIRQVLAALTALGIGGYSFSQVSKDYHSEHYDSRQNGVKLLSSAGLATVLGAHEVLKARKKQKEAEKEIARLQAAQAA